MKFKNTLGLAATAAIGVAGLGLPGSASAAPITPPATCSIQTFNTGNFVTAVGGGGRTTDVIHTDATRVGSWERFTFVSSGDGRLGIRTVTGNLLTAVSGGGRTTDVIHSDAVNLLGSEKFSLVSQGNDVYAIQTANGNFLTAVGGGGRTTDTVHSDATRIGSWELFRIACGFTTVPNVLGFDQGSAQNTISNAGLTTGRVSRDNTCIDVAGTVLQESPGAGATVPIGSAVNLTVSSGVDTHGRPCIIK